MVTPIPARIENGGPEVIEALGSTLLSGTSFLDPEYRNRLDVVVINETLARQLSSIVPALGRRIKTQFLEATVIGIARDLVDAGPHVAVEPLVIQRTEHRSGVGRTILVRTTGPAEPLLPSLRRVVEEDFGPMRSTQLRLLADDVDETFTPWQGRAAVLSVVAWLSVPMAIVGLAGGLFVRQASRIDPAIVLRADGEARP
jgi:hypothetical protein